MALIRYLRCARLFSLATNGYNERTWISLGSRDSETFCLRRRVKAYKIAMCCETQEWLAVTVDVL